MNATGGPLWVRGAQGEYINLALVREITVGGRDWRLPPPADSTVPHLTITLEMAYVVAVTNVQVFHRFEGQAALDLLAVIRAHELPIQAGGAG